MSIYIIRQFGLNLKIFLYLLSIKMLLNTFLLTLKIEILLSKSSFKVLSIFTLLNNIKFDIKDFIEFNDLMCYN